MLRSVATALLVGLLGLGGAATAMAASNPNTTGPPSQTCLSSNSTSSEPGNGHAATSPGSPFNESKPGTGGANYSPTSQYDVACYQVTQSPH